MIKQNVTDLAGATGSADFEIIAIVSAARSRYWLRLFIFIAMSLRNTEDQLGEISAGVYFQDVLLDVLNASAL